MLSVILISELHSQDFTEKDNFKLQRTEYYDLAGKFLGYSKENMQNNVMEYYDSTGQMIRFERQDDYFKTRLSQDRNVKPEGIKKWNSLYRRYDVFDSTGNKLGHYIYDPASESWKFIFGIF